MRAWQSPPPEAGASRATSLLLAARVDLRPGIDSETVDVVSIRIKRELHKRWPAFDHVLLDITDLDGHDAAG